MKWDAKRAQRRPLSELKLAVITSALLASSLAWSQTPADDGPRFSLKGFGTLGLAHSTVDQADVLSHGLVEHGAGHTDSWSYKVDSRLGVQLDAYLNDQVSGLLQVTSEQRHDGSFRPQVEWANIKYQPTSALSLQIGRSVLPSFLVSDYRLVGYANHWVRPPMEVYNLVPITSIDGVTIRYRSRVDELNNTMQVSLGELERKAPDGITIRSKDGWNVTNTSEYGSFTFNVTYQRSRLAVDYPALKPLFDGYRNPFFGAAGQALADKYDPSDKTVDFAGIGASYDPGNWFVMGEWGQLKARSILGDRAAWYVSSGYRTGRFTPYVIYARSRMLSASSDPGLPTGAAATLNAELNKALAASHSAQETLALGVRWDFASKAALKVQFDHVDLGANSAGELRNVQPGFVRGGSHNIVSVTLDFLF